VQFCSALKKDDASQQMVYYQPGVGTYSIPQLVTRVRARFQKYINMAIANHLSAHVMSGYEFLMQNYRAMDKICIFGFSRGAYTARALAGMIHKASYPQGTTNKSPSHIRCILAMTSLDGNRVNSSRRPFRSMLGSTFLAPGNFWGSFLSTS